MENTVKKNKFPIGIMGVLLLLSAFVGIYRFIQLRDKIEAVTGLYTDKMAKTTFTVMIAIISLAVIGIYFYAKSIDFSGKTQNNCTVTKAFAYACALGGLAVLVTKIYGLCTKAYSIDFFVGGEIVLIIPAIMYFVLVGFDKVGNSEKFDGKSIFSVFPVVYLLVRIVGLFIDKYTQINSSERSFGLLALVCIMMFFTTEAEVLIPQYADRDAKAKKYSAESIRNAKYLAFGLIAVCFVVAIVLPSLIFNLCVSFNGEMVVYCVFEVLLGAFALTRTVKLAV